MIRTACLLTVNNILAATGAALGTVTLAANAVLFQMKDIMSYLVDGMANGASIFSGRALGQKSKELFWQTLRMTYKWLFVLIILLMSVFALSSTFWISCFTDIVEVAVLAEAYKEYVLVIPFGCRYRFSVVWYVYGSYLYSACKKYDDYGISCFFVGRALFSPFNG